MRRCWISLQRRCRRLMNRVAPGALLSVACLAGASVRAADYYVDSLGGGDGSSPDSPFSALSDAIAIAGTGDTIWICGGSDRSYIIGDTADAISLAHEGLSISGYGDERPLMTTTGSLQVASTAFFSIDADNVTITNLAFCPGGRVIGKAALFSISGTDTTFAGCDFSIKDPSNAYQSDGGCGGIISCASDSATGLRVRGCTFRDLHLDNLVWDYRVIVAAPGAEIVQNFFTNCYHAVTYHKDAKSAISFISNRVVNAHIRSTLIEGRNQVSSFGYTGAGVASSWALFPNSEVAYNIFVDTENDGGWAFAIANGAMNNSSFHHNTIVGYHAMMAHSSGGNQNVYKVWNNLVIGTPYAIWDGGSASAYKTGSIVRSNACTGDLYGSSTNTVALGDGVTVTNNVALASAPVFRNTTDFEKEDYYRYSAASYPELAFKGWTGENGNYPTYIGAVEPNYQMSTLIIMR